MGEADAGLHLVDVLAARAAGVEEIEADVGLVELDIQVVGLGEHGDGGGGGVDASLGLGFGDALHAVDAALVLESGERAVAVDLADHLFDAAGGVFAEAEHVGLPSLGFGVADVGAEQIAGPESCFVAADAGADFDDHAALVVGVAGQQRAAGFLFELRDSLGQLVGLGLREFAQLGVVGIGEHLAGLREAAAGLLPVVKQLHDGLKRGVLAGESLQSDRVGADRRVGHFTLDRVAPFAHGQQLLPHDGRLRDFPMLRRCQYMERGRQPLQSRRRLRRAAGRAARRSPFRAG